MYYIICTMYYIYIFIYTAQITLSEFAVWNLYPLLTQIRLLQPFRDRKILVSGRETTVYLECLRQFTSFPSKS